MTKMAACTLVGLYSTLSDLPRPAQGASYAVFQLADFSQTGMQAFLQLVPALGNTLAESPVPLRKIEGIAQLTDAICDYVARGRMDEVEALVFLQALRQMF